MGPMCCILTNRPYISNSNYSFLSQGNGCSTLFSARSLLSLSKQVADTHGPLRVVPIPFIHWTMQYTFTVPVGESCLDCAWASWGMCLWSRSHNKWTNSKRCKTLGMQPKTHWGPMCFGRCVLVVNLVYPCFQSNTWLYLEESNTDTYCTLWL